MAVTLSLYDTADRSTVRLSAEQAARAAAAFPDVRKEMIKWPLMLGQGHLPPDEWKGGVMLIDPSTVQAVKRLLGIDQRA